MKIRNRKVIRFLARSVAIVLRGWLRMARWTIVATEPGTNVYEDTRPNRYLYCLWHDALLCCIVCRRPERTAGLVSYHADGEYVADIMQCFGIRPIRGSSGRRGAQAVRTLMTAAADYNIAIATDGPRGPRREVKDGILYLASHSQRAIVPVAVAARRAWRPRGRWTDMVIPLPLTRAWMLGGPTLTLPPGLRPDQLGPYRQQLQDLMDRMQALADRLSAGEDFDIQREMQKLGEEMPLKAAA